MKSYIFEKIEKFAEESVIMYDYHNILDVQKVDDEIRIHMTAEALEAIAHKHDIMIMHEMANNDRFERIFFIRNTEYGKYKYFALI